MVAGGQSLRLSLKATVPASRLGNSRGLGRLQFGLVTASQVPVTTASEPGSNDGHGSPSRTRNPSLTVTARDRIMPVSRDARRLSLCLGPVHLRLGRAGPEPCDLEQSRARMSESSVLSSG